MAAPKTTKKKVTRKRRKKPEGPVGLAAPETRGEPPPPAVRALAEAVDADGGAALCSYREPLGGHWLVLAALPLEKVEPTPFQRDVSEAHARRLTDVMSKVGRFLDPVIAVRQEDGRYWTPNGNHRCHALRALGAQSVTVLLVPEREVAFQILALNTEKAHNLREKSLEVIRMARSLAPDSDRPETDFAFEFEEAPYLTLGLCYEKNGRFGGGAYHSVLKRVDAFLDESLKKSLAVREKRAARLLELDERVAGIVKTLRDRGFQSPYLRPYVVARLNPLRFRKGAEAEFDETLDQMLAAAAKFDAGKVKESDLARAAGPPEPAE
jgi:ParB family chromosome partitioning protein